MIDNTIHPIITFTGSGLAGFFMGMFLRRVLKFLVIIIGLISWGCVFGYTMDASTQLVASQSDW
jgi:hypothetical protein